MSVGTGAYYLYDLNILKICCTDILEQIYIIKQITYT
jgi:hypothetical protein